MISSRIWIGPALALWLWCGAGAVRAEVVFFDDFDDEGLGLFYDRFANFTVIDGYVDSIGTDRNGNEFFDVVPGNGVYVDLDGSFNDAGTLVANPIDLGPGLYELSFDLAGSNRDEGNPELDEVFVAVWGQSAGTLAEASYLLSRWDPFGRRSIAFALGGADRVSFSFRNPGDDNYGALLDRVELARVIPEPSTIAMLSVGLAGLAGLGFRSRWRG